MNKSSKKFLLIISILMISMLFIFQVIYAGVRKDVEIKLDVDPDIREIVLGTEKDILIAIRAKDEVICFWELDGPGELIGDVRELSIPYKLPSVISGSSTTATITATVTDTFGNRTKQSITFKLFAPPPLEITTIPTPEPILSPPPTKIPEQPYIGLFYPSTIKKFYGSGATRLTLEVKALITPGEWQLYSLSEHVWKGCLFTFQSSVYLKESAYGKFTNRGFLFTEGSFKAIIDPQEYEDLSKSENRKCLYIYIHGHSERPGELRFEQQLSIKEILENGSFKQLNRYNFQFDGTPPTSIQYSVEHGNGMAPAANLYFDSEGSSYVSAPTRTPANTPTIKSVIESTPALPSPQFIIVISGNESSTLDYWVTSKNAIREILYYNNLNVIVAVSNMGRIHIIEDSGELESWVPSPIATNFDVNREIKQATAYFESSCIYDPSLCHLIYIGKDPGNISSLPDDYSFHIISPDPQPTDWKYLWHESETVQEIAETLSKILGRDE